MSGRLGIDFGTSNTVLAAWDEACQEGIPLHLPDYGCQVSPRQALSGRGDQGTCRPRPGPISIVPSVIHYASRNCCWLGQQVLRRGLFDSRRTFRWMKRYNATRSPVKVRVDGRRISHFDAGRDFLTAVLSLAVAELGLRDEEVALTVPVEAFEHYQDWLTRVAESAGLPRLRIIDEPSAAALGYGVHLYSGEVYLIVDFGGGTLDVAVVLIEEEDTAIGLRGRRCRVLGKAGAELGGATIDQWLFQEVLRRNDCCDSDDDVLALSRELLSECERAKEQLSIDEQAEIRAISPVTGTRLAAELTRDELEDLLERHEALGRMEQTLRQALQAAGERGYTEDDVRAVLMVGGSSSIPCVQRTVQRIFGRQRVFLDRPLEAVARGAAAFVAGVDFYNHIQHDYALRYVDPENEGYGYRPLVSRGTPYPTREPVARLTVKASYPGQVRMGLAIFEVGREPRRGRKEPMELVFTPSGAARMAQVASEDERRRRHFWINEHRPTFLAADPPIEQGEPCFEVEFGIDANKCLLITARDLATGQVTYRDCPVVKLA